MRLILASILIFCSSVVFAQAQLIINVYPPTCEGCCDGAINLSIGGCLSGSYDLTWTGPAIIGASQNLSDICEPGVYNVAVTDENGQTIEASMELAIGATPYTIIENFTIDCVNGGGIFMDCFFFPPTDSLSNGEACAVPPDCWVEPASYLWLDDNGNIMGTEACLSGLFPGDYSVIITGDEGEQVFFDVPLFQGAPIELISQDVCPSGLHDFESVAFELYPNPASDHILLTIDLPLNGLSYRIVDLQGREVMEGRLISLTTRIDLSALKAGSYLVYVMDGGTMSSTERVVLEE